MYTTLQEIIDLEQKTGTPFWELVCKEECEEMKIDFHVLFVQMREMYQEMKRADKNYDPSLRSHSGLAGSDGQKMAEARKNRELLCGDFINCVMEKALKMGESNACMRKIVAAPTAGSCGVLSAVLLTMEEQKELPEQKMIEALFVAAGIGGVIAAKATLAGAAGGCQAEIGAASSMAAGAAIYLMGGNGEQISHGAALAMKGLLGLVCDPVAGLVEVPCIKRNVIGAVNALTSADLVLSGIRSRIPADEVFDAMRQIGRALPEELRETAKGGLAVTPTGKMIQMMMEEDMSEDY